MRTLTVPDRLENEVQRATIAFYSTLGCDVRKFSERRTGRTRVDKGWPDLAVFHIGKRAFWLHETKRDRGGRQSAEQSQMQQLAESCGVSYLLGGVQAAHDHLVKIGVLEP